MALNRNEDIDDEQTTDRRLRSLRREARILDEEDERDMLIKHIATKKKLRMRRDVFGVDQDEDRNIFKQPSIIKAQKSRSDRINRLVSKSSSGTMLGKSNLSHGHNILKQPNMMKSGNSMLKFGKKRKPVNKQMRFLS